MKLLFCTKCNDMFKLSYKHKTCECGEVSGNYINSVEAVTNGKGISIAIGNGSLQQAIFSLCKHKDKKDRDFYIKNCRIEYCWVRPNEGNGNPHTKIED